MKIYLVRHGQTESNYLEVCQGATNNLLNDTGRRQCQKLRDQIRDINFDICYCSPMIRTVETAMILIGDRVRILNDERLKDRYLGDFEGKDRSGYSRKKYWDYKLNSSDGGVEPVQDIFKRCQEFLDYMFSNHSDGNILIVGHASTIRAIRHLLLKTDLNKNLILKDIGNCYFEEIEIKK